MLSSKIKLFVVLNVMLFLIIGCNNGDKESAVNEFSINLVKDLSTDEPSGEEVSLELPEKSIAEILRDLENQQFSIKGNQISDDDRETVVTFGKSFVNLYSGAVAEQKAVSFKNYISNENLLTFTNKMLELEQRRELKGGIGVIFGLDNEFKEAEFKKLGGNVYYVSLLISNQGSVRTLKMLVQAENKALRIVDLYFGNKDGVDTIVTGHPANRKLHDPKLWDDQVWVDGVSEKLEKYESELMLL